MMSQLKWLVEKGDRQHLYTWPWGGTASAGSWSTLGCFSWPATALTQLSCIASVCRCEPQFNFVHIVIALLQRWLPPLGELSPYLQKSSYHFSACSDLSPCSDFCPPLWLCALITCLVPTSLGQLWPLPWTQSSCLPSCSMQLEKLPCLILPGPSLIKEHKTKLF